MIKRIVLVITALVLSSLAVLAGSSSTDPYNLTSTDETGVVITLQPATQSAVEGATVTFSVEASGSSLQYQWLYNGDILVGATASTLTIANVTDNECGAYEVIVYNSKDGDYSDVAELRLVVPGATFADNFASRTYINTTYGLVYGSSVGATTETGEPKPCNGRVKSSVWISWIAPATGVATFATVGSGFDTVLGVYTGSSVGALTEVATDDDGGDYHTSVVAFVATAGTAYQIYIGSLDANGGYILFGWTLNQGVQALPTITSKPSNLTTLPGAAGSLSVQYTSSGPVTIQWYHNGQPIPGANQATLQWTSLKVADLGSYYVSFSSGTWIYDLKPVEIQFNSEGIAAVGARNKLVDSIYSSLIGQ